MGQLRIMLMMELDGHAEPWTRRCVRAYPADVKRSSVEGQLFLDADEMFSELQAERTPEQP